MWIGVDTLDAEQRPDLHVERRALQGQSLLMCERERKDMGASDVHP